MSRSGKISYNALAIEGLKEVLIEASQTCNLLSIDFFIVGAVARNIWYASNEMDTMGTKDIDFAVRIPHSKYYTNLKDRLIKNYAYVQSKGNSFCLISPKGLQFDLLTFGEIENDGSVLVEGEGLTRIKLEGFKEVFASGLKEITIGENSYTVCSIPGMVILKLIALDDRPERRLKDIVDISRICKHYPDLETNNIWDNHSELYINDRSHEAVAMMVLGREMREITLHNNDLHNRVNNILTGAINGRSNLLDHMIEDAEINSIEQKSVIILNTYWRDLQSN